MKALKRLCIIGLGNTLRSDDGLGVYVCEKLKLLKLPDVSIRTAHQLQTEWIFEFVQYESVLIIDAAAPGTEMKIAPLNTVPVSSANSSHHLNPNLLKGLMALIHDRPVQVYALTIPGENFDLGEALSTRASEQLVKATDIVLEWMGVNRAQDA